MNCGTWLENIGRKRTTALLKTREGGEEKNSFLTRTIAENSGRRKCKIKLGLHHLTAVGLAGITEREKGARVLLGIQNRPRAMRCSPYHWSGWKRNRMQEGKKYKSLLGEGGWAMREET